MCAIVLRGLCIQSALSAVMIATAVSCTDGGSGPYFVLVTVEDPNALAAGFERLFVGLNDEDMRELDMSKRSLPVKLLVKTGDRTIKGRLWVEARRGDGTVLGRNSAMVATLDVGTPTVTITLKRPCNDAAECSDGDPCNGVEPCTDRVCETGGTPCVSHVECVEGSCLTSPMGERYCEYYPIDELCEIGEVCNPEIGCIVSSCETDQDCTNHLSCDGEERCISGLCVNGPPPDTDDGNPCTEDSCFDNGTGVPQFVHTVSVSNDGLPCGDGKICVSALGGCVTSKCGDGYVDAARGEECDDGNASNSDACVGDDCRHATCGDGWVHLGTEECDDNNDDVSDACVQCARAVCGDGVVRVLHEECDDGNANDEDDCLSSCHKNRCGDGIINPHSELCDDGNLLPGDGCRQDCKGLEECGDGLVDTMELCDVNDPASREGCRADCSGFAQCGDGVVDPGEVCDDGNRDGTDNCRNDCRGGSPIYVWKDSDAPAEYGSAARPYLSIAEAVRYAEATGVREIWVGRAQTPYQVSVDISAGLELIGGYDPSLGWQRPPGARTEVRCVDVCFSVHDQEGSSRLRSLSISNSPGSTAGALVEVVSTSHSGELMEFVDCHFLYGACSNNALCAGVVVGGGWSKASASFSDCSFDERVVAEQPPIATVGAPRAVGVQCNQGSRCEIQTCRFNFRDMGMRTGELSAGLRVLGSTFQQSESHAEHAEIQTWHLASAAIHVADTVRGDIRIDDNTIRGSYVGVYAEGITDSGTLSERSFDVFSISDNDVQVAMTNGSMVHGLPVGVFVHGGPSGCRRPHVAIEGNLVRVHTSGAFGTGILVQSASASVGNNGVVVTQSLEREDSLPTRLFGVSLNAPCPWLRAYANTIVAGGGVNDLNAQIAALAVDFHDSGVGTEPGHVRVENNFLGVRGQGGLRFGAAETLTALQNCESLVECPDGVRPGTIEPRNNVFWNGGTSADDFRAFLDGGDIAYRAMGPSLVPKYNNVEELESALAEAVDNSELPSAFDPFVDLESGDLRLSDALPCAVTVVSDLLYGGRDIRDLACDAETEEFGLYCIETYVDRTGALRTGYDTDPEPTHRATLQTAYGFSIGAYEQDVCTP